MNFKSLLRGIVCLLTIGMFFTACQEENITPKQPENSNLVKDLNSNTAEQWIDLYMEIEKDLPSFRPAATSRALAYIWMAAYETAVPGMPDFKSNEGASNFKGLDIPNLPKDVKEYDWNVAVNTALYVTTNHFMWNATTEQKGLIKDQETTLNNVYSKNISQTVFSNSQEWGRAVAEAVIAYAKTDLEAESQIIKAFDPDYLPQEGEGKWRTSVSLGVSNEAGKSLFPHWGKTRSFVTFGSELLSPPPPAYSTLPTSQYYKDFYEVYDNVKNLNKERQWRAEFWSDDIVGSTFSPPARLFQIANQMIQNENMNLETSLHCLFKLGIAENDAAVAAWGSKYYYNVERPIHFITQYIDKDWRTPLGRAVGLDNMTPPFPGYPSGHSTFGGLGISVLSEFFGHEYTFTDRCHQGRTEFYGEPRTYTNQTQIGEENAFSRIPLGVHPRFDCTEGLRLGKLIGQNAVDYNVRKN
jgi:hypothetical protein